MTQMAIDVIKFKHLISEWEEKCFFLFGWYKMSAQIYEQWKHK